MRKLGTVRCTSCGGTVDVGYPFSNSDRAICMSDHTNTAKPLLEGKPARCHLAGMTLVEDGRWCRGATAWGITPTKVDPPIGLSLIDHTAGQWDAKGVKTSTEPAR